MTALMIARCVGKNDDVSLTDFLFDPPKELESKPEADLEAAKAAFGFKPRAKNG